MKRILIGIGLFLGVAGFCDFSLVKDGKATATILLKEENPTVCAQFGALELQYHVKQITGAELPIAKAGNKPSTSNVIVIGGDAPGMLGDASAIEFNGNTLRLYGNDTSRREPVNYNDRKTFPRVSYECKGSLFAVYDFLELYCGVRFFGIREYETYYPKSSSLSVQEKNRRHDPKLDAFRLVYIDDNADFRKTFEARQTDIAMLRWRCSTLFGITNHNQYSIYFAHWDKAKNPNLAKAFKGKQEELFAKGFKGKRHSVDPILRNNYPDDPDIPPQLCYSNQGTVEYYAKEVLTYFNGSNVPGGWGNGSGGVPPTVALIPRIKGKPFFYPIQGGDTGGHCLCDDCKKRFPNDNKDDVSHNKFQFIADVAREAAKTNPEAGVSTLAYIQTLDYPDGVDLPKNVSVQICLPYYSWWHPVAEELQKGVYKTWIDKEAKNRPLTLWTYIFSTYWDARYHYGNYKAFPGLYPHKTGELFKMFTSDGIRGWFTEVEMGYNFLEAYIAARLCYDPTLNPEQLIDEYFPLYYGEAGTAMREVYEEIEHAYWNPANCKKEWLAVKDGVMSPKGKRHKYWTTGIWSPDMCWTLLGTDERMAKIDALLKEAQGKVKTDDEKKRLNHFIDHIWKQALDGKKEYKTLALRKQNPPKRLAVPVVDGTPSQIDWSKSFSTGKWKALSGSDTKYDCTMDVLQDAKFLHLRFKDANAPTMDQDLWYENIELFFAATDKKSALQIAIAPKGEFQCLQHTITNGEDNHQPVDIGVKVKCAVEQNSWSALIDIPLDKLPAGGKDMLVNFYRSKPSLRLAWNPIYGGAYMAGIDFYGRTILLPYFFEENQFVLSERGKYSGIIDDKAAHDGKAAWMNANASWTIQMRTAGMVPDGKYNVTVAIRCDEPSAKETTCGVGIYDTQIKREVKYVAIPCDKIVGDKYVPIDLGEFELNANRYFFVRKFSNNTPDAKIYVDCLSFRK